MSNWETYMNWITSSITQYFEVKCVECGKNYRPSIHESLFSSNATSKTVYLCGESCFSLYVSKGALIRGVQRHI